MGWADGEAGYTDAEAISNADQTSNFKEELAQVGPSPWVLGWIRATFTGTPP